MIKFLDDLKPGDIDGKKVLLRVDFNVLLNSQGKIIENYRIKSHRETVDYLLKNGAKVLLLSHITATDSFLPLVEEISTILGQTLTLIPSPETGAVDDMFKASPVLLRDNIRLDKREEENDSEFARGLAEGFDLYVNDAFSVSHRNHATVAAVTKFLPAYGGLLLKKELENLSRAIEAPMAGKILVVGGVKISTKEPVIKNFLDKAEKILIGGAIANDFFDARGINVGDSVVDDAVTPDLVSPKIILPEDILVSSDKSGATGAQARPVADIKADETIVDIGPESAEKFSDIIRQSSLVIWNGPLGLAEVATFAVGTKIVAQAVAAVPHSIIGGGDTIAAIDKLGWLDKYTFVSTGGGAMLEFLAGNKLPGLEALGYYG